MIPNGNSFELKFQQKLNLKNIWLEEITYIIAETLLALLMNVCEYFLVDYIFCCVGTAIVGRANNNFQSIF